MLYTYQRLCFIHIIGLGYETTGCGFNGRSESWYSIGQSKKFTFKFLVKDGKVPDVRGVFYFHGKKKAFGSQKRSVETFLIFF